MNRMKKKDLRTVVLPGGFIFLGRLHAHDLANQSNVGSIAQTVWSLV